MGYERSGGGIPCVGGSKGLSSLGCGCDPNRPPPEGGCGCLGVRGAGLPPIGSGAIDFGLEALQYAQIAQQPYTPKITLDVMPEVFPVGARAILATPTKDYSGQTITTYKFTSSGRWVTLPGQLEYYTSFGELAASEDVYQVVDGASGRVLWPVEAPVEIPQLPEFETVDPPPPVIPAPEGTPLTWPHRAPMILRERGEWVGYADLCDRLPYPGTRPFPPDFWIEEATRHLAYGREQIKAAADCVAKVGDPRKKQGYDPTYCNLAAVPDFLALAFDFIDDAFCDMVDAYKDATAAQRDDVVGTMIDVMHSGLTELRAIIPIIAAALKRAYAEGYSQGWIDGFAEGYEEGLATRQDEWDKLLDDLKGMLKVGLPIAGFVIGGLVLLGGIGWAVSKWRK